ncbi:MAG: hypothetical protein ACI90V_005320, partial [Bacillariaceae sp.]
DKPSQSVGFLSKSNLVVSGGWDAKLKVRFCFYILLFVIGFVLIFKLIFHLLWLSNLFYLSIFIVLGYT